MESNKEISTFVNLYRSSYDKYDKVFQNNNFKNMVHHGGSCGIYHNCITSVYDRSIIGNTNKIEITEKNNEYTVAIHNENLILIRLNRKKQNKSLVILDEDELILI